MSHSLTSTAAATKTPFSPNAKKSCNILSPSVRFQTALPACHLQCPSSDVRFRQPNAIAGRRIVTLGLTGVFLGLTLDTEEHSAIAAGKRPPPPLPKEKQDPNVSGTLAKVLASKKRKEAMKEAVAKLREKGKPIINEPSS